MIRALSPRCTPAHPLTLDPIRCELWRGDVLESVHEIHAALVDEHGQLLASAGDPQLMTTARSSLKPFQLLPTLLHGGRERFELTSEDLALMCASHNGEPLHTERCARLLDKLEVGSSDLECGAHLPYHKEAAHALIREGVEPSAIHNNCSGKHCGMLTLRALLEGEGVDVEGSYLSADHPVQAAIFECVESLLGAPRVWRWGTDGCSLPTPEISLHEFATLFAYLAKGSSPHHERAAEHLPLIFDAMSAHPELVAGSGRFDTAFMRAAEGRAVCKVGGEAIRGFALRDATGRALGLTLKARDGAMRALHPACLALLEHVGLIERPTTLHRPLGEQEGLDQFWRGVELNWAGVEATEMRVRLDS